MNITLLRYWKDLSQSNLNEANNYGYSIVSELIENFKSPFLTADYLRFFFINGNLSKESFLIIKNCILKNFNKKDLLNFFKKIDKETSSFLIDIAKLLNFNMPTAGNCKLFNFCKISLILIIC